MSSSHPWRGMNSVLGQEIVFLYVSYEIPASPCEGRS